jgi:hypothetical protein
VADVAARIRSSLVRRGANSLVEMGRSFRQLERRRTGSVTLEDFSRACSMYGIKLSEQVRLYSGSPFPFPSPPPPPHTPCTMAMRLFCCSGCFHTRCGLCTT